MDLQNQLKSLEEKIAYARQFYNDVVQKYNTQTEVVPTNIIAGLFHFEQAPYFQVDEADRQVPQVKFRHLLYGHLREEEARKRDYDGQTACVASGAQLRYRDRRHRWRCSGHIAGHRIG